MNWRNEFQGGWEEALLILRLAFLPLPFTFGVTWSKYADLSPLPLWADVTVTFLCFIWGFRCCRTYPWKDLARRFF